jgi:sialidase-1
MLALFGGLLLLAAVAEAGAFPALTDVFVSGKEGYACFRIPALVFVPANASALSARSVHLDKEQYLSTSRGGGTLLAFAEGRRYSCNDHGAVDLVVKHSQDQGRTWTPLRVVHSESTKETNTTIGNPAPVVLRDGTLLLPFSRNNTAWGILRSPDGGATWSRPVYQPIPSLWFWVATGPPGSVQLLPSGRILVPFDYQYDEAERVQGSLTPSPPANAGTHNERRAATFRSSVFISDDNGQTWRVGGGVDGGNECQAVPLPWLNTSTVLLSMRAAGGISHIASLSTDSGLTFSDPWPTVTETQCEASTIALPLHPAGPRVYMSSAFSTVRRADLTLHVTGGHDLHRWTPRVVIYPGPAAYSAMVATGPADLAVLFERDAYASISLATLINVPA